MAETDFSRLRAAALMLPEADRAALAHALVKSLDAPADSDIAQAWEEELLHRLNEIDSGSAKLIDRGELRRRRQAHIGTYWVRRVRIPPPAFCTSPRLLETSANAYPISRRCNLREKSNGRYLAERSKNAAEAKNSQVQRSAGGHPPIPRAARTDIHKAKPMGAPSASASHMIASRAR